MNFHRTRPGWPGWLLSAVSLSCQVGCGTKSGPEFVPVTGRVLVGDRPVKSSEVVFDWPGARAADPLPRGEIQADGRYTIRTGDRAGAPAGRYRVAVVIEDAKEAKAVPPGVGSTESTPLSVEVARDRPAGAYDLNITPRPQKLAR